MILLHWVVNQCWGEAYIDSCLNLVSCKYPHLDSCISDVLDRITDTVLELVFNSSGPNELEVFLDLFIYKRYFLISVCNSLHCFLKPCIPLEVLRLRKLSLCQEESSQTFLSEVVNVWLRVLQVWAGFDVQSLFDYGVCSFREQYVVSIWILYNDRHALSCTCELQNVHQSVAMVLSLEPYDHVVLFISLQKLSSKKLGCVHECQFIRWRGIVLASPLINHYGVTQCQMYQ